MKRAIGAKRLGDERLGLGKAHPRLLLGLLLYGYATDVFSNYKLDRATYDGLAVGDATAFTAEMQKAASRLYSEVRVRTALDG